MRIGINATLVNRQRLGVASYVLSLVKSLSAIDQGNEYFIFASGAGADELSFGGKNFSIVVPAFDVSNSVNRILWEQTGLPNEAKRLRLDVLHNPDHALPIFPVTSRNVITVHDLAFIKFPKTFSVGKRIYKQMITNATIKKADAIIAVSNSTRSDIMELFDIPRSRINVIYEGVDEGMKPVTDALLLNEVRRKYRLGRDFILFVGALEPRKNIPTLLKAFQRLSSEGRARLDLLVVGGRGWLSDSIFDTAKRLNLGDSVKFVGFVQKNELAALYTMARAFVYPSLHEGFGFPPLEAMACGTPVITSNTSSLPEVIGNAAVTVAPLDDKALSEAMGRLLRDDALRADLIKKGFERVGTFSWERCARETVKVYERTAGK